VNVTRQGLDIWVLVLIAAASCQVAKTVAYSVAQRRLNLVVLAQSAGLPSLHAVVGAALLGLLVLQTGVQSSESAVALVFLVIAVFDSVRVRGAAEAQRRIVHGLVLRSAQASELQRRVVNYLDPFAHAPAHVAVGLVWGGLFAMAFAAPPR
jgi:acid phosphatase family membrane protein YuiD